MSPADFCLDAAFVQFEAHSLSENLQNMKLIRLVACFSAPLLHGHDSPQSACCAIHTQPHDVMNCWSCWRKALLQEPLHI